jgi:hypothetical protein
MSLFTNRVLRHCCFGCCFTVKILGNRDRSSTHLSLSCSSRPFSSSPPLSIIFGPYCSVPSPPPLFLLQFFKSPRLSHIRTPAYLSGQKALSAFCPSRSSIPSLLFSVSASWPLLVRFPFLSTQVRTSGRVMLVHYQREKLLLSSDPETPAVFSNRVPRSLISTSKHRCLIAPGLL